MSEKLDIPIEAFELGYFSLNPSMESSKDLIYKTIILKILREKGTKELTEIKKMIVAYINLPSFKIDKLISELIECGHLNSKNNNFFVTSDGKKFLENLEKTANDHLNVVKSLLLQNGVLNNQIDLVIKALNYIALKDSDLLAFLMRIRKHYFFDQKEQDTLEFIIEDSKLREKIIEIINNNIFSNESFQHFFISLVYGHIVEYLLLSSSDGDLSQIFDNLRNRDSQITVLLDTNVIIALVCHSDFSNKTIFSLFEHVNDNKINIKFYFNEDTIDELSHSLNDLDNIANSLEYANQMEKKKKLVENPKSTLAAFCEHEDRYRDWKHYKNLFFDEWKKHIRKYPIEEMKKIDNIDIDNLRKDANRYSQSLVNKQFEKNLKVLRHDIFLILLANEFEKFTAKNEHKNLIKNIVILSLDSSFEDLEKSVQYLNSQITKKALNLRQFIAYLSPIFMMNKISLDFGDKLKYASLIENKKDIQILITRIIEKQDEYTNQRVPRNTSYERLHRQNTVSKEIIFEKSIEKQEGYNGRL